MEFTPRVRQILLVLLRQKEVLPVKNLALQLDISKRTVQRELEYISYILKKYNLNLCTKTGAGIWLEGEESHKQELLDQLENQDDIDYADKPERRRRLVLELLKDQTPKKLYYYANLFSVSEATISNDLESVEPWFRDFELQIIRKQGYGITVQGSEKNFRLAIREFIAKYMDKPVLSQLYGAKHISTSMAVGIKNIKNQYQILDEDILRRVGICLGSIQDERIRRLTEESYISLVLHVTIALERLREGEVIEQDEELMERLKQDEDFNLALLIVNSLEEEFGIEIPDIEIVYICLHIKGSKLQRASDEYAKDDISPEYQKELEELVQEMIVAFDDQLAYVLGADEEFVTGLAAHLRPTMVRLRNHMHIENPHLDEIKESYAEVYKKCQKVGKFMEAVLGYEIPDTEIGFLAIHFGAALVRMENEAEKKRTVDVGLVCASGIGISRLMASRLKNYLKTRVNITTYGKSDLTPFVCEKNDFFVSSMELGEIDADVIQVSPLLPEGDLVRIGEKVDQYASTPKKRKNNTDFVLQMEKINYLASEINEILSSFFCCEVEEDVDLRKLLEAAARRITPYKENQVRLVEDIRKREEIASQIIPELSIALFHARSIGVFQTGFFVCIPKNHGRFRDAYLRPVEAAVIMLLPEDEHKQENSRLLGHLSENLIEDERFLADIKSGDEGSIRDSLSRLLKQYFNKYLDVV